MELNSPYRIVLGEGFETLHPHVQVAHLTPLVATGEISVTHGTGIFVRCLIRAMKLPRVGEEQVVHLKILGGKRSDELIWERFFGGVRLETRQFARNGCLVEQSGPARVEFRLRPANGDLLYCQSRLSVGGITLPARLSPRVDAVVSATDSGWHVSVTISFRGRLICQYSGEMRVA